MRMALVATILGLTSASSLARIPDTAEMDNTMDPPGLDEPEFHDIDYDVENFYLIRQYRDEMRELDPDDEFKFLGPLEYCTLQLRGAFHHNDIFEFICMENVADYITGKLEKIKKMFAAKQAFEQATLDWEGSYEAKHYAKEEYHNCEGEQDCKIKKARKEQLHK